jgi:hypothetical protein
MNLPILVLLALALIFSTAQGNPIDLAPVAIDGTPDSVRVLANEFLSRLNGAGVKNKPFPSVPASVAVLTDEFMNRLANVSSEIEPLDASFFARAQNLSDSDIDMYRGSLGNQLSR